VSHLTSFKAWNSHATLQEASHWPREPSLQKGRNRYRSKRVSGLHKESKVCLYAVWTSSGEGREPLRANSNLDRTINTVQNRNRADHPELFPTNDSQALASVLYSQSLLGTTSHQTPNWAPVKTVAQRYFSTHTLF
jgi:hypothetical protein